MSRRPEQIKFEVCMYYARVWVRVGMWVLCSMYVLYVTACPFSLVDHNVHLANKARSRRVFILNTRQYMRMLVVCGDGETEGVQ